MDLSSLFEEETFTPSIQEKIQQRRSQMLVHSYLYYQLDTSIVDDGKWQDWADELSELQNKHPKESKKVKFYYKAFKDWDGSTGCHLPTDKKVQKKVEELYKKHLTNE